MNLDSLRQLYNQSWEKGIPAEGLPKEATKTETDKLWFVAQDIMKLSRDVKQDDIENQDLIQKLSSKCWTYACSLQNASAAFKACKICIRELPGHSELEDKFTIIFDTAPDSSSSSSKTTLVLKNYYKEVLAGHSEFFRGLFKSGFQEANSRDVIIKNVNLEDFQDFLSCLEGEKPYTNLEEVVKGMVLLDRFGVPVPYDILEDVIKKVGEGGFKHIGTLIEHVEITESLRNVIGSYYERSFFKSGFESIEECLEFINNFGDIIKELNLEGLEIKDEHLETISKKCPQLVLLKLYKHDTVTDRGLSYLENLKKLDELNLTFCQGFTDKGLESVSKIENLKILILNRCYQITSNGLMALDKSKTLGRLHLVGGGDWGSFINRKHKFEVRY